MIVCGYQWCEHFQDLREAITTTSSARQKPTLDAMAKILGQLYSRHTSSKIHHPALNVEGVPLLESLLTDPTWMKAAKV